MVRAPNVVAESRRLVSMRSLTPLTASSAQRVSKGNKAPGRGSVPLSLAVFFGLALGGCALDLATKGWIFQKLGVPGVQQGTPAPPIWIIDGIFGFETSLNEGALFGMGQGQAILFAVLSVAAAVGILGWLLFGQVWRDLHLTLALGLVMAGILGNLYDRLGGTG